MNRTLTTPSQKDFISIKEASILSGIQAQTLRKLGDEGKIRIYRTVSGQRKFHRESLEKMCYKMGGNGPVLDDQKDSAVNINDPKKQNFIYCRVSTRVSAGDFEKQRVAIFKEIQNRISAAAAEMQDSIWSNMTMEDLNAYKIIKDVSSGTNFKRKGLEMILKACMNQTIGNVIISKKNRLAIFGYELIEELIRLGGGRIIVVNQNDNDNQLYNQELLGEVIHLLNKTKSELDCKVDSNFLNDVSDLNCQENEENVDEDEDEDDDEDVDVDEDDEKKDFKNIF